MGNIIDIVIAALAILLGLIFGTKREKAHYKDIIKREAELRALPVLSKRIVDQQDYREAKLVLGNIVIANDRFKETVATLKSFFGGRLTSYESLLDRARREAILRVKEEAYRWGAREIVDLRVEASSLDRQGVEIFASGTALK